MAIPSEKTYSGHIVHPKDVLMNHHKASQDEENKDKDTPNSDSSKEDTQEKGPHALADDHDWKQRYSDLKSYVDRKDSEHNDHVKELQTELDKAKNKVFTPPKTEEEVEKFKEQYPDLYDQMVSVAANTSDKISSDIKMKLEQLDQRYNEVSEREAKSQLLSKHPDAYDLKESEKFKTWLSTQPSKVQDILLHSNNPDEIIWGFDLYKSTLPQSKDDSDKALEESKLPNTRNSKEDPDGIKGKIWLESEVHEMASKNPHWFEMNEPEIDKAISEGRFKYDLSS